jgi:hypothetical protein
LPYIGMPLTMAWMSPRVGGKMTTSYLARLSAVAAAIWVLM